MRKSILVAVLLLLVIANGAALADPVARMQGAATTQQQASPEAAGTPDAVLTVASLLGDCPCEPTDFERFHELVYPSGLPMTPASGNDWTRSQRDVEVAARLDARITRLSTEDQERAREVFKQAREIMDVRLAAALTMLVGTSGEPAIDVLLEGDWDSIGFGPRTRPGWTIGIDDSEQWDIVIDQSVQYEDFIWIAPVLVREALHAHRGDGAGREEEAVAVLMQRVVLLELLDTYPEIATQKTAFSRSQLTYTLALLYNSNSVLEARGDTVFPGGAIEVPNVWDDPMVGRLAELDTIAPPVLGQMFDTLGVDVSGAPDANDDGIPDYTKDLLTLLQVDTILSAPNSRLSAEDIGVIGQKAFTIDFPEIDGAPDAESIADTTPVPTATIALDPSDLTSAIGGLIVPTVAPTATAPGDNVPPVPTSTAVPPPPPTSPPPPPPTRRPPTQPPPTSPPPTSPPPTSPPPTSPPPTSPPPTPTEPVIVPEPTIPTIEN